jgi:cellulose synthase/poly-beta-1,6-N-acetylglucosamine synthase-like glycosyltransferase
MTTEILFWGICALIGYTYIGYPLVITLLSFFVDNKVKSGDIEPFVSLIISAYNEEKDIKEKIDNSLKLDYPSAKLEIIIASDGSTDATDVIVRGYEENNNDKKVILHRVEGRQGKTAAQNSAVKIARGEVIVFSDAASLYDRGAIRALVRNYADPTVGAVSGMYKYINKAKASVGSATIVFWNFENFIKSRQTRIKTVTGCCGCIYSVRKVLYTALPPIIISDLVEPLTILKKGYRIVFEPRALAFEETTEKTKDEFKMRVRVIVRGMNGLLYMRTLLNPFRYPFVAFQLLSHKVLRWFIPVFCLAAFLLTIPLSAGNRFYQVVLTLQMVFYALAVSGMLLEKKGIKHKIFYLPMYFTIVNAASLVSLFKVFKGENIVVWQTQR